MAQNTNTNLIQSEKMEDPPHEKMEGGMMRVIEFLPESVRKYLVSAIGETIGTASFLFVALSGLQVANLAKATQAKSGGIDENSPNAPDASTLMYIALVFGFSLALNAWIFFRVSGGLFNPAVTLGMLLIGARSPILAVIDVCAQLVGAITASGIVEVLFPGKLEVTTTLSKETSLAQGVFIEALLTAVLVFTIFMLAAEKHKATFIAPIGIGLALFVCELSGVYFTGGSLNPARSFGPCVVLASFPGYFWIYVVGPFIGSLFAVAVYKLLKVLEYESVHPDQDKTADDLEAGEVGASRSRSRSGGSLQKLVSGSMSTAGGPDRETQA